MNRAFLLFLLLISNQLPAAKLIEDKNSTEILTPSLQNRETRKIRLENGLEAYLISDPDATQAAAALSIEAGSFDDPVDAQGMAHFLEHMLFLGTSAYPTESGYQTFVTENGGHTNAYTASDHTNYAFAVNHEGFEEALDRFSWFFKEPLFNPSGVEREMRAVDQEHNKNIEAESFREYYAFKAVCNPEHPFHRFQTGNLETLSEISQESLKEWYATHYSANLMHLVVISNQSLDTLEEWVERDFSAVPNQNLSHEARDLPITTASIRGHRLLITPLREMRKVAVSWELPRKFGYMLETQPDNLIGHILGHEGEESLLAQLKRENLAEGLSAGGSPLGRDNFTFQVEIKLTAAGIQRVDEVVERCFQAIARLRSQEIPQYLFDETQQMQRLAYQYQQRSNPFYLAMRHARQLVREPLASYPELTLIPQRFDREATEELLSLLTPEESVVTVVAKATELETTPNRRERWLGAPYAVEAIDASLLSKWSSSKPHPTIALPVRNPLIPEQLELVWTEKPTTEQPTPKKIIQRETGEVYYAVDSKYLVPETVWIIDLLTPAVDRFNGESLVMADLYVKALEEKLNPFGYQALVAGLGYNIERRGDGVRLSIEGYSQKANRLLSEILKNLKTVTPTVEQFKTYKEALRRQYANFNKESPLKQGGEILRTVIYKEYITEKAKAEAVRKITYKDFLRYRDKMFEKSYAKGTLYGNLTEEQARAVWREVEKSMGSKPYPSKEHIQQEAVFLPQSHGPYYVDRSIKRQGNAALLMIQNGPYSFSRRAAQQILATAIEEPFYTELRTLQQTGYLVFSWDDVKEKQLYSFFATQSSSHDARDLLARFELLIETFLRRLGGEEFPEEKFLGIRDAIVTKLSQPPKNQSEMGERLHSLAFDHEGDFDWMDKRITAAKELTFGEFTTHAKHFLGKINRQRVAVLMHGLIETPDYLQYSRIRSPHHLKKMSDYLTKEEALNKEVSLR